MVAVPFQKILVGIDESEVSNKAFDAAANLAKAFDARLMIIHVLNPHDVKGPRSPYTQAASGGMLMDEDTRQQFEQEWISYVKHYESLLERKADEAIAAGIEADFIHPQGSAESTLCEVARTHDVNLIVVGSHQRRGMAEVMLGSTSNYITHHAPCSVLVVNSN
jgi:nucleotide-binding universal stress UspA family protein